MALRFRRDVQKASYYVWFLGAEEAKGFRGPKVFQSVLPYLIDRSTYQEPLKITLQVSHKGIKIVQGSSKHIIPHGAITSSIQIGDIVACILLLYNPATKCPLHVHAYRCDSETTAESLHQQLEVLINRPENQKQFEQLESRLGISRLSKSRLLQDPKYYHQKNYTPFKKSDSSIESTTTSRDSECSGSLTTPISLPTNHKHKRTIFDSLAAELKAKLNGSGPPLLLPPRDYDTVHRSKGNIFRNQFNGNEKLPHNRNVFLSSENYIKENISSMEHLKLKPDSIDANKSLWEFEKLNGMHQTLREDFTKGYHQEIDETEKKSEDYHKQLENKEDKIRPVLIRPINLNMKLKNILSNKKRLDMENFYPRNISSNNQSGNVDGYIESSNNRLNVIDQSNFDEKFYTNMAYKGKGISKELCNTFQKKKNLTDKQKHLQIFNNHEKTEIKQCNQLEDNYNNRKEQYRTQILNQKIFYPHESQHNQFRQSVNLNFKDSSEYNLLPNRSRNSLENTKKSQVVSSSFYDQKPINFNNRKESHSGMERHLSAKDRFYGAKEKFRLIERSVSAEMQDNKINKKFIKPQNESNNFESKNSNFYCGQHNEIDFVRQPSLERSHNNKYPEIKNAKSLNNLSKGYRHSYAEVSQLALSKVHGEYGLLATHFK